MNTFPRFRTPWILLLLSFTCLVLGCGGNKRVNKENFAKIKEGMSLADVEAILGKGDSEEALGLAEGSSVAGAAGIGGDLSSVSRPASGMKWMRWGDDARHIRVGFVGDKVAKGKIESKGL